MRVILSVIAGLALVPLQARADAGTYQIAAGKDGPGIELRLPYSVGTHEVRAGAVSGEVRFDPDAPASGLTGTLVVTLQSLVSGNGERDCHMREALGLDYARSRYPKDHVCSDDRLPASGADAVVFPDIRLEVRAVNAPPLAELAVGREVPVELQGAWTIHGVSKPAVISLRISRDAATPGALRVKGQVSVRLADYGVVVKSAKVLVVTISVGEVATVLLDLRLVPARPR